MGTEGEYVEVIANQERDDQHDDNRCQEPQWVLDR